MRLGACVPDVMWALVPMRSSVCVVGWLGGWVHMRAPG